MLENIIGQPYAIRVLQNYVRERDVTGSFLFVGPANTGKATTAFEFAKLIACLDPQTGPDCCGRCSSCRAIDAGQHPDVRSVQPTGPSRILRIPQIWPRDGVKDFPADSALLHDLQFAPVRGPRRIFIIEDADALNEDTANSILKVLEEPPSYAIFILTAPSPSAVLPTVFSRCQTVRFQSVATDLIETTLIERKQVTKATARFISAYCQGKIGTALQLAGDEDLRTVRESVLLTAEQLSATRTPIHGLKLADDLRKAGTKLSVAKKDSGSEEMGARQSSVAVLEILAIWYRDLLALCATQGSDVTIVNIDHAETLSQIVQTHSSDSLMKAIELTLGIRDCVERNANAQIAFEALALKLVQLNVA